MNRYTYLELFVLDCDDNHWGVNCAQDCDCADRITGECDKTSGCVNCTDGWTGDQCLYDINECSNSSLCSGASANCTNTDGSYFCTCNQGYEKPEAGAECAGTLIHPPFIS